MVCSGSLGTVRRVLFIQHPCRQAGGCAESGDYLVSDASLPEEGYVGSIACPKDIVQSRTARLMLSWSLTAGEQFPRKLNPMFAPTLLDGWKPANMGNKFWLIWRSCYLLHRKCMWRRHSDIYVSTTSNEIISNIITAYMTNSENRAYVSFSIIF